MYVEHRVEEVLDYDGFLMLLNLCIEVTASVGDTLYL